MEKPNQSELLNEKQKIQINGAVKQLENVLDFIGEMKASGQPLENLVATFDNMAAAYYDLMKDPNAEEKRAKYVLLMNYRNQLVGQMLAQKQS